MGEHVRAFRGLIQFNKDTFERVPSPLSAAYWQAVFENFQVDLGRLRTLFSDAWHHLSDAISLKVILPISAALVFAYVLIIPLRIRLQQLGLDYASTQVPQTRARRSILALWFLLVGTATTSVAFIVIVQSLDWTGSLTVPASTLAWTLAFAGIFGSVAISLGSALLLVDRQSWRLLPIEDREAEILRPFPVAAAFVVLFGIGLTELNRIVGASPAANVTANLLIALLHLTLLASVLLTLRKLRKARDQSAGRTLKRRSLVTFVMLLGWVAVVICLLAIIRGNVNLALLVGREIIWASVVISFAYLLMTAADDVATTVLSAESRFGGALTRGFGLREGTVRQTGLLISAVARVTIGFLTVSAIVAPLGGGPAPAYTHLAEITTISLGGIVIQPGALIRALAVFMLGLAGVRFLGRWMERTYLPATELDVGARTSALSITRYIGIIVAAFWAISTLGIGMERIALLASALSVGIGFGLQAITQNFISGLILLAERPIKIGDTIQVGTDEGDVKRISVRSTEIQIGDRSTLIVPNSELITKTVRNMTLANPLGRVQVKFSIAMDEDVEEIIDILLELFTSHTTVLDDPTPTVMIDSLADEKIHLNGVAFVPSPRLVYATRSDLMLRLLKKLRERGVASDVIPTDSSGDCHAERLDANPADI